MVDDGLKKFARILRHQQTDAEKKMWWFLRAREFQSIKFRRQHPLGPYITDFCSLQGKIVIELDGGQHGMNREKDEERTSYLQMAGFQVLRFWDHEVLNNTEAVLEKIRQQLN
jgi:very-short-patch-repair endonuclease